MPMLPWGQYKPDTSDYEATDQVHNILNVVPRADGYGPWPALTTITSSLPSACRGAVYALNPDGSVSIIAGTSNGLYILNNTTFTWTPVMRSSNCTITNASPGVVSLTNTFVANEPVVFEAGSGTLPTQITAGTVYYVSATSLSGSSFKVSTSPNGTPINTSGGSGTVNVTNHYASLGSSAQWQFAQTGSLLFATQVNEPLQVFTLQSSSNFSNSLGSPPQAAYISVVGQFLVLSGILSFPYRIQWSGLGDFNSSTSWTVGTNSSDFQDFTDGGLVRGVAGGEFGTIFQDQAIRWMNYVQGVVVFQIQRVTQDQGLLAPYSIIRAGSSVYYCSSKGFFRSDPGTFPVQIGRERVDRSFISDLDGTNLQLFIGCADPKTSYIYWAYKSTAGATGLFDKILGYDPVLDKFFPLSVSGEYLLGANQPSITLESLDAIAPTPLTVTAMANNGSGNTRLTFTAESNANFSIAGQNSIVVYNATGTTGANGTFLFQSGTGNPSAGFFTIVDSTHVDLGVSFVATGTAAVGGSIDAMLLSLDTYVTTVRPLISAFDSTASLGFFTGPNLEATMEGGEQGTDGERIMITGFRPITDAPSVFGALSYRETQQQTPTELTEVAINSRTGRCDMRASTRYSRYKVRIPSGTTWSFCAGVEPEVDQDGAT